MNQMISSMPSFKKKQSGSILIVVIFVIVVMGLLAGTMARLEWSNQDTQSREIMGTRALFMVHSANEWALTQLFPLGKSGSDLSALEQRCNNLQLTADPNNSVNKAMATLFSNETEYKNCAIKVLTCAPHILSAEDSGNDKKYSFFKVHAMAQCGDNQSLFQVERAQDVVVKGVK